MRGRVALLAAGAVVAAAAAAADGASAGLRGTAKPEYLLAPESLGVGGFNNLDPFDDRGKIRSQKEYITAMQRRAIMQANNAGPLDMGSVRDPASVPELRHPERFAQRTPEGNVKLPALPPVVLGLLEEGARASATPPASSQGTLQQSTDLETVPTYTVMPEDVPYAATSEGDPFDPGRIPLPLEFKLKAQRAAERASNPNSFVRGPVQAPPPPGSYTG